MCNIADQCSKLQLPDQRHCWSFLWLIGLTLTDISQIPTYTRSFWLYYFHCSSISTRSIWLYYLHCSSISTRSIWLYYLHCSSISIRIYYLHCSSISIRSIRLYYLHCSSISTRSIWLYYLHCSSTWMNSVWLYLSAFLMAPDGLCFSWWYILNIWQTNPDYPVINIPNT